MLRRLFFSCFAALFSVAVYAQNEAATPDLGATLQLDWRQAVALLVNSVLVVVAVQVIKYFKPQIPAGVKQILAVVAGPLLMAAQSALTSWLGWAIDLGPIIVLFAGLTSGLAGMGIFEVGKHVGKKATPAGRSRSAFLFIVFGLFAGLAGAQGPPVVTQASTLECDHEGGAAEIRFYLSPASPVVPDGTSYVGQVTTPTTPPPWTGISWPIQGITPTTPPSLTYAAATAYYVAPIDGESGPSNEVSFYVIAAPTTLRIVVATLFLPELERGRYVFEADQFPKLAIGAE